MSIKGVGPLRGRVVPHLVVRDVEEAVRFYQRALGAEELYRSRMPFSDGVHVQLRVRDAIVMVSAERAAEPGEERTLASPESLRGTSVVLTLFVDDADAAYDRAVRAGAKPTLPVTDAFWGDRFGWVADPFGHLWALAAVKEELEPAEVERRKVEFVARLSVE